MKITAFRNRDYNFTADLYTYSNVTDASGGQTRNYTLNRNIKLTAVTTGGAVGKVTLYLQDSDSDVTQFDQLRNFKGPDGNELFPTGIWQVDFIGPFINVWGRREGFKARATVVLTTS